jgi:O-antigen/teichoic acid export membrane protein
MSSVNRFLSASAAAWVKILLTVLTQILLVPVFLTHWSVEQYGCWLIIQTVVGLSSMLSSSHQAFLGYEFLKVGDKQTGEMRRLYYSALPYVFIIAVLELLVIVGLIYFGVIRTTFDPQRSMDSGLLHQAFWSLILYSLSWLVSSSVAGLAGRAVYPYGHFARMNWWGTILAFVQALTSGVAVALGADLLHTVLWIVIAGFIVNIPIHLDMWRMFRRHKLHPVRPDWKMGYQNVSRSLLVALGTVLDISRQQGVRIFLGALVGVEQMTAFSTMRTMSNLSLQGIGTITNPIMPEIMRFLRDKDTERTNATVGFVWFLAVILLSPVLIGFQWLMPIVYHTWTRGKIAFDPALFGIFSINLLVFSIARPPMAVLQGNNLLKVQLGMSIAGSLVAVGGILAFTAKFGVIGAAFCLLAAELLGTILAVWYAWKWLDRTGIGFPWRLFRVSVVSIMIAAITIAAMSVLPALMPAIIGLSMLINLVIAVVFFRRLPPLVLGKVGAILKRIF